MQSELLESAASSKPDECAGARLPSEPLTGRLPASGGQHRAYLSNVCVAESARRQVRGLLVSASAGLRIALTATRVQGIGAALLRYASTHAAQRGEQRSSSVAICALTWDAPQPGAAPGVQHLYVHVAADNAAAQRLYRDTCGFEVEQEEQLSVGRAANRGRHLLLHKRL